MRACLTCDHPENLAGRNYRDGIISGVVEAIDLAANAFFVLQTNPDDEHVQQMCRFMLGETDFDARLAEARGEGNTSREAGDL